MTIEVVPPAVTPPVANTDPPAVPPVVVATPIGITADQLKTRLAEEKAKGVTEALKALGFDKPDDAKTFTEAARKAAADKMTVEERTAKELADARSASATAVGLIDAAKPFLQSQLASLPEAARATILAKAGDDVAKQIEYLNFMRDSGAFEALTKVVAPALPHLATTTPPSGAPPPGSAPNKWQEYQTKRAESPISAALFYDMNKQLIEASRPPE